MIDTTNARDDIKRAAELRRQAKKSASRQAADKLRARATALENEARRKTVTK